MVVFFIVRENTNTGVMLTEHAEQAFHGIKKSRQVLFDPYVVTWGFPFHWRNSAHQNSGRCNSSPRMRRSSTISKVSILVMVSVSVS